jgi:hypothetical protein
MSSNIIPLKRVRAPTRWRTNQWQTLAEAREFCGAEQLSKTTVQNARSRFGCSVEHKRFKGIGDHQLAPQI